MNWVKRLFTKKVVKQCAIHGVIHWVSMNDKKPSKHRGRYLIYDEEGNMEFETWYRLIDAEYWGENTMVTHWAEIPKPPCV